MNHSFPFLFALGLVAASVGCSGDDASAPSPDGGTHPDATAAPDGTTQQPDTSTGTDTGAPGTDTGVMQGNDGGAGDGAAEASSGNDAATDAATNEAGNDAATAETWTDLYTTVISTTCTSHHGSSGGLDMSTKATAYTNLVGGAGGVASNKPACMEKRVVKGDAANSLLYQKVSGTLPAGMVCGVRMPKGGPALSAAQQQLFMSWINAGALDN